MVFLRFAKASAATWFMDWMDSNDPIHLKKVKSVECTVAHILTWPLCRWESAIGNRRKLMGNPKVQQKKSLVQFAGHYLLASYDLRCIYSHGSGLQTVEAITLLVILVSKIASQHAVLLPKSCEFDKTNTAPQNTIKIKNSLNRFFHQLFAAKEKSFLLGPDLLQPEGFLLLQCLLQRHLSSVTFSLSLRHLMASLGSCFKGLCSRSIWQSKEFTKKSS